MQVADFQYSKYSILEVVAQIDNPFIIDETVFNNNTYNNATLFVLQGTKDKYKTIEGWKKFLYVEEGLPSNIKPIECGVTNILKRYTLDGKDIKDTYKGINIILMNNGTTKKVLIK